MKVFEVGKTGDIYTWIFKSFNSTTWDGGCAGRAGKGVEELQQNNREQPNQIEERVRYSGEVWLFTFMSNCKIRREPSRYRDMLE